MAAGNVADAFVGLPIETLILEPLISAAKGQAALSQVTLDFVNDLAFFDNEYQSILSYTTPVYRSIAGTHLLLKTS